MHLSCFARTKANGKQTSNKDGEPCCNQKNYLLILSLISHFSVLQQTPGMLKKQALHFNHFFVNPFNRISDVTMSFRYPYSIGDALTSINGISTRVMSYRIVQETLASGVVSSVTFEASKPSSSAASSVFSASSSSAITIDTPTDPRKTSLYLTFGGNDSSLASAAESDPKVATLDGPT